MKLNITARYLLSLLFIVVTVFFVNGLIFIGLILYQQEKGHFFFTSDYGENFARSFMEDFSLLDDGTVKLSDAGYDKLKEAGAWIEILNEEGTVVQTFPEHQDKTTHYRPVELIHRYKYMDDELNTYFIGEFEQYSYLVINPNLDVRRYTFLVNDRNLFTSIADFTILALIINLFIALLVGYVFSLFFTRPIKGMTKQIKALKERRFIEDKSKEKGIYKKVFADLNDVAHTLQQYEKEREKLEVMREEWIRNVSHDIKTPLSSIRGYAELLKSDGLTDEERLQYASVVERQSLYIRELLDDFNLSLRLRNEELSLKKERTNMVTFVRELVIDLLNDPQFQTEEINFRQTDEAIYWEIDRHLMKRAILNLLYNAFIHNDKVQVTVTIAPDRLIIEDDGIGISKEEQAKIFDRYYRATNTKTIKGTGLGMAISRDIIEAHQGKIELESEPGLGTKITLYLT